MWRGPAAVALVLALPTAALAQAEELAVRGSVTGELVRGQQVTVRATASHPDGFQALSEVGVALELHEVVLEELRYDLGTQLLEAGGATVLAGTGNVVEGRFFRVQGLGLRVTTAGNDLTLSFRATLIEEVPPEARFRFTAEDDDGEVASTALKAAIEEDEGGLSLGTVILAVIGALLAGGFIGGQLTASRRPRTSVYSTVARKIERDRLPAAPRERS